MSRARNVRARHRVRGAGGMSLGKILFFLQLVGRLGKRDRILTEKQTDVDRLGQKI